MSYPFDNSNFLLARWRARVAAIMGLGWALSGMAFAQTEEVAYRSSHFRMIGGTKYAEKALQRLESLRTALVALQGEEWVPARAVAVWIPSRRADWRRVRLSGREEGLYFTGPRTDWLAVQESAADLEQVLGHEYLHAVLDRVLARQPAWLVEGLCEYYSTLRWNGARQIAVGAIPNHRRALLKSTTAWSRRDLETKPLDAAGYAWAWARVAEMAGRPQWKELLGRLRTEAFRWEVAEAVLGRLREPLAAEGLGIERKQSVEAAAPPLPVLTVLRRQEAAELEIDARHLAGLESATEGEAERGFLKGLRLLDDGRAQEAIRLLEDACRARPSQSSWWLALATAYSESGDRTQRKEAIAQALASAATESEKKAAQTLAKSWEEPIL